MPGSDCSDDRQKDCDNDKRRVAKFWIRSGTIFAAQVSATKQNTDEVCTVAGGPVRTRSIFRRLAAQFQSLGLCRFSYRSFSPLLYSANHILELLVSPICVHDSGSKRTFGTLRELRALAEVLAPGFFVPSELAFIKVAVLLAVSLNRRRSHVRPVRPRLSFADQWHAPAPGSRGYSVGGRTPEEISAG